MLLQPLPGETAPFRSRVADFYRGKGYQVRENARVRGASENVYAVDMVATGPLGALLVSFGDAAGVDGPELGRVRKLARDIGATPVIAAPEMPAELRRMAAQFGVVVVDDVALVEPNPIPNVGGPTLGATEATARDLEAHPWPASGRARPDVEAPAPAPEAASLWRNPVAAAPRDAAAPKFSWLQPATPEVEPVAAPATPLTSAVLGLPPAPVPLEGVRGDLGPLGADEAAVEHEAVLLARKPSFAERVEDTSSLLKFSIGAIVGAALLFLAIRLLA